MSKSSKINKRAAGGTVKLPVCEMFVLGILPYLSCNQLEALTWRLMSPSFSFSFHDRWEISLLSNIVSWFYELNPSAEVDGGRKEAFVQGPLWKP